jgi:translation initiation factor 2B subunit (eIF-2B alpha/beta/delta family)
MPYAKSVSHAVELTGSDISGSAHRCRKEMRNMPWYTNPVKTCKVLNRIASRYENSSLENLKSVLDHVTESIWKKQEQYYENCR